MIPANVLSNGPLHDQTYSLTGLQIATVYETSVVARNVFGWSKASNIFKFGTIGAGNNNKYVVKVMGKESYGFS